MLNSKLTAYSVTELAWMLEPKEQYGKVHRQYHSAPKTTTHCPARGLKFIASSLLHTCDSLPAVQSRIGWPRCNRGRGEGRKSPARADYAQFAIIHELSNCFIKYFDERTSKNPPIDLEIDRCHRCAGFRAGLVLFSRL